MSQNEDGVVELLGAGVPGDQGLSTLGLLMQLAGTVMGAFGALLSFVMLFAAGGGGDLTIWMLVILALCVTRSMYQRAAGTELLYGKRSAGFEPDAPHNPIAGVQRYIMLALIQTVVLCGLMAWKFELPGRFAFAIGAGLAAWPITLAVIFALPRFQRFKQAMPQSEDKSFEATSIVMTILGVIGVCATGTILCVMFAMPSAMLRQGPVVLMLLTLAMLVVRSLVHVHAGIAGLRETNVDRAVELANRYANFGVISSFCAGGAMLLMAMTSRLDISGIALVVGMCWLLMAWPLIIRRFFSERQFSDLLAGDDAPIHRRAPDAGLTGLGWLLIAFGALAAASTLPELIIGTTRGSRDITQMLGMLSSGGDGSVWWKVGQAVLQLWAGYELVRMSPQHRIIANVYAVVYGAVTIYLLLPVLHSLGHLGGGGLGLGGGAASGMKLGVVAASLVIPVATLVLVNRKLAPTATARFRPRVATPVVTPVTPITPPPVAPEPPVV